MKTCFEILNGNFPIRLEQRGENGLFRVTYGKQVQNNLTYDQAASDLGAAIMHNAALEGKLGNEGK
jgi:hypothetical protein